jgi:RNA polymerase sigma-70 factor (ECF subfamily)
MALLGITDIHQRRCRGSRWLADTYSALAANYILETSASEDLRRLMTAYQDGSVQAFEHLYVSLSPIIKRTLTGLTGDPARSADLTQETFLQIHRARPTYDPSRPLLPWVLAIARHVYLMDERSRRRRVRLEPLADYLEPAVSRGMPVNVDEALARIPAAHREAWILHHVNGLSFREIASVIGATVAAAKLRSSRAAARLRELLGS